MINQFVENEIQHLPSLLIQIQAKERANLLVKLLPFIFHKAINPEEEENYTSERHSEFINGIVEKIIKSQTIQVNF